MVIRTSFVSNSSSSSFILTLKTDYLDVLIEKALISLNKEGINMTGEEAAIRFMQHAYSKGYKRKVVGHHAFSKKYSPQSPIIKMLSAKNNKIQIFETGVGRYEITMEVQDA